MTSPLILFVGPLPPPVHGFSEINRRMLARLQENSSVTVFDVSPKGSRSRFSVISHGAQLLWQIIKFFIISIRGKRNSLYIPLSGGYRQFIDACFAIIALLCGMRVFVHHHSFAYLNRQTVYARIVLRIMRNSVHIVLCERMGELLCSSYAIPKDKLRVISNAVFLEATQKRAVGVGVRRDHKLIVGFLSNITAAKGCFDFIDLVKAAVANGMPIKGVMAGPVHTEIKQAYADALNDADCIKHIGPVYGGDKQLFLSQIDVLVFPTRYANEAEPVTIWEAMAAGVPVIALSRGCISGMVTNDVGWVIEQTSNFIDDGLEKFKYLLANDGVLVEMKTAAQAEFEKTRLQYAYNLDLFLVEITSKQADARPV